MKDVRGDASRCRLHLSVARIDAASNNLAIRRDRSDSRLGGSNSERQWCLDRPLSRESKV